MPEGRPKAFDVARCITEFAVISTSNGLLKIAAAVGDLEGFHLDLSENLSKPLHRLHATDRCYVIPGQVTNARDENGQGNAMNLHSSIPFESGTDDPAVKPIDANVPAR